MLRVLSKYTPESRIPPFRWRPSQVPLRALFIATFLLFSGKALAETGNHAGSASQRNENNRPYAAGQSGQVSGSPRLDTAKVHMLYTEGNFEQALAILEEKLKDPRQYGRQDSVFIYKHLGVMYAASEATREKGKYYMHRLLSVEPNAKIVDMYVSDKIYMIFRTVKEEFTASQTISPPRPDTVGKGTGAAEQGDKASALREKPNNRASGYIWLGAVAIAAATGALTWYYYSDKPEVEARDHQPN